MNQLPASEPPEIRMAFRPIGGLRRGEPATAEREIPAACQRLAAAWNAAIPRHHVRVLNGPRYYAMRDVLLTYREASVQEAIAFYGRQRWNLAHNAWQTFDHWMDEANVGAWIEKAAEAAEQAAAAEQRRRLAAQAAQAVPAAAPDGHAELTAAWDALDEADRQRWIDAAAASLPAWMRRMPRTILREAQSLFARDRQGDDHGRSVAV